MNEERPRHILIIKLGALGDFIQALGPMAAIRAHHSHDHITLLTTKPFADIALASGYVNDIWIDTRPKWFEVKAWLDLRKKFNAGQFSRVYDLQNNDRTSFYLKLFSPRPEWVGVAKGASHRNNTPERTAGRAYDGHVQTLTLVNIKNIEPDRLEWMRPTGAFESLRAPFVLIVPGSAPNHPEKRWPPAQYINICNRLTVRGYQPVLIGTKAEIENLNTIADSVPGSLNLGGQTSLFDIAALARHAQGAIGNDTGPMHLIAPTGCKSIVLFSKNTNPKRHAPLGRDVVTLQKDALKDLSADDVWNVFERQQSPPP